MARAEPGKASVMAHGPRCARSVRHDLGPNIFRPARPNSVNKYIFLALLAKHAPTHSYI